MAPIAPLPFAGALLTAALVWLSAYALSAPAVDWRALPLAPDKHVMSLVGALRDGEPVLLAGTHDGTVFRQRGAADWTQETVAEGAPIIRLAFGEAVYAATGNGVYRRHSTHGWQPLASSAQSGQRVADIITGPLGTFAIQGERILRLTPSGWTPLPSDGLPALPLYRLAATAAADGWSLHASAIGQGVYTLMNEPAATHWRANRAGLPEGSKVFSLLALPSGGLIVGTDQGVFHQSEPFARWQPLGQLLQSRRVLALAYDPESRRLWAGTDDAVYRTDDRAADPTFAWRLASANAPFDASVSHLTIVAGTVHAAAGSLYRFEEQRRLRPLQLLTGVVAALAAYLTLSIPRMRRR